MKAVRAIAVITLLLLVFLVNTVMAKPSQQNPCPGAPASFLSEQARGRVTFTPFGQTPVPVRVRSQPGQKGKVIAELVDGTPFTVISKSACADGMVWWQIKTDDGISGWVAEGDSGGYFVEPADHSIKTAPTPTVQASHDTAPVTHHMPLGYIRADNNLYVTDLSARTRTHPTRDGTLPLLDCGASGVSVVM